MRTRTLAYVLAAVVLGPAAASFAAGDKPPEPRALQVPRGGETVTATGDARIMALIQPGGGLIRAKGVASVTTPQTGIYCLRPSSTTIDLGTVVPVASVDYSVTSLTDAIVQIRSNRTVCTGRVLEFVTLDRRAGGTNYRFSNAVQFSVVVP